MAPAMAAAEAGLQPFGNGFQLSSIEFSQSALTGSSNQLLVSTGSPMAENALSLTFLGVNKTALSPEQTAALEVSHVFTGNPQIIGLFIEEGERVRGSQMPYQPQPGDTIRDDNWIERDGELVGYLVNEEQSIMRTADRRIGGRLDTESASNPGNYRIVSEHDGNYADGVQPEAVFRKSKPMTLVETANFNRDWVIRHTLYLQVTTPLTVGERYRVEFEDGSMPAVSFVYEPLSLRSEAVQVSHIGFAPNDPTKVAFLSTWMGDGGPLSYGEDLTFYVVDDGSNEVVFEGPVRLSKKVGEPEDMRDRDYTGTDVYRLDFSALKTPGRYRVAVEGVGSSFPFEIKPEVWKSAFYVSARGLLHQRSGIALGPPYTDYERPRPFHPEDGVKVYRSTVPLMDTRMGLNRQVDAFKALQDTQTEELDPEAWGGWFDAGDWDRRIQHLDASRLLLELVDLHPDYFKQLNLNLPESNNSLPDVVDEALWGLDVFKRLQLPDGGVRGGIESASHPNRYEASWQESQDVMTYGPGVWSSYFYAGAAAKAAYVLADLDPQLAASYRESSQKAMTWAEAAWAEGQGQDYDDVALKRNLAAAELYRLTGDDRWHQLFLDTTVFAEKPPNASNDWGYNQREAAFVYALTEQPSVDLQVQENARAAVIGHGDFHREAIANTAFGWNKHPYAPMGWGTALGSLKLTELLRAYALTREQKYLQSAILAAQFALGANPDNTVYTTGLGYRFPQDPLIVDINATGKKPPAGITVFGPLDLVWQKDFWFTDVIKGVTYPEPANWPTVESYFDSYVYVPVSEYTVMQSIGPTAYGLGFLAAEQE